MRRHLFYNKSTTELKVYCYNGLIKSMAMVAEFDRFNKPSRKQFNIPYLHQLQQFYDIIGILPIRQKCVAFVFDFFYTRSFHLVRCLQHNLLTKNSRFGFSWEFPYAQPVGQNILELGDFR